jgi:hypothetical protein
MSKELLKKWLEALIIGKECAIDSLNEAERMYSANFRPHNIESAKKDLQQINAAIDEIEAELAKPEPEPEPVGFVRLYEFEHLQKQDRREDKPIYAATVWGNRLEADNVPLYTSPRPMQRLTDEEIAYAHDQIGRDQSNVGLAEFISGARFAESVHNQG